MTDQDFKTAIQNTELFKSKFPLVRKAILDNRMPILFGYYRQAKEHGIWYLQQNPEILQSEVKLINEILKSKMI